MARLVRKLKRVLPPRARQLVIGARTYLPGAPRHWSGTGGTDDAAYCYEVFLKHRSLCFSAGMRDVPRAVAEIGPGDSIGVGIAALLAGSERYAALDVVPYALTEGNQRIFRDLAGYFAERRPNPSWGFPNYDAIVADPDFVRTVIDGPLATSLAPARLAAVEHLLAGREAEGLSIGYHVPWTDAAEVRDGTYDWVFSHSTMEHVDDIETAYRTMFRWLRPGGYMSHQIDLTAHRQLRHWNEHWAVPAWQWRIMRGRRLYYLNRYPYSAHAAEVRRHGELLVELRLEQPEDAVGQGRLRPPFHGLDDAERLTCSYFMVARKPL